MDQSAPTFVFVSYSRANKDFVERLVSDLQARGITCWIDRQGLKPGIPDWEHALREAIRSSRAVLLAASRESRQSRYVKAELDVADMYRRTVFPVWIAGEQWIDSIPMGLSVTQFVDARGEHYAAALDELTSILRTVDAALLVASETNDADPHVEPRNPYKGLRAFYEEDAGDFFGRTQVIADLVEALQEALAAQQSGSARLLVATGPSGSGKSSVVMAGLLPRLKSGVLPGSETWVYLDPMTPGTHPLEALTVTLAGRLDRGMTALRQDLADDSSRGLHLLARCLAARPGTRVVLLIDQFEELFRQTASEDERRHFIDLLVAAVTEPGGPVVAVLTVRADFYHQIMYYADLWRLVEAHTRYIAPLSVQDLREVIERPAELLDTRLRFEGDLLGDLLFEVRDQVGALPLLQFTLDQLFQRREGRRLTVAAYRAIGGVRGALTTHAEEVFAALPSNEHRELARALFLRLIEPGMGDADTTRRRVNMTELVLPDPAQTAMLRATAAAFVEARLLFTNEAAGATTLEVSHEALVTGWPRLQGWIDEDHAGLLVHRALTAATEEWQRLKRDEGALYRGTRLATATEWDARNPAALNEMEWTFLRASEALQARERRAAQQRVRRTVGGLLAGIVAMTVVAVFAVAQWHQAVQAQAAAIRAQRLATSRELAANAMAQLSIDPELSLLLARQAAVVAPTTEAEGALRQALLQAHLRATFRGHTGPVNSASFNRNGALIVTASDDNTARIWAVRTQKVVRTLHVGGVRILDAAFSPNGRFVVTAGDDGVARLWDASTGTLLRLLCRHKDRVNSAAFSPTGSLIVTASEDGTAQVCATSTGKRVWLLGQVAIGRGLTAAAFSPDGRRVVTASKDGAAQVWNLSTGKSMRVLGQAGSGVAISGAAFSPNGRSVVTASSDSNARIWDVASGKLQHILIGQGKPLTGAAFSPDGTLVVTPSADGTAQIWDASNGASLAVLRGHTDTVTDAAFSPNGRVVVTASADGTARLWDTFTQDELSFPLWQRNGVTSAAFSPDGALVVTGHNDDAARVWQARTGRLLRILRGHAGAVTGVAFSANGARILTVSAGGTVGVWAAASGKLLHTLHAQVTSAAISPDGARVVTTGGDGSVQMWSATSARRLMVLNQPTLGPATGMTGAAFSPDGSLVVALGTDQTARVWDVRTGSILATVTRTQGDVSFSPDSALLLRVTTYGTARVCWARTGVPLPQPDFGIGVTSARFSPDGRTIVTGSANGTTDVWQVSPRNHVLAISDHTGSVTSIAVSRDGTFIVTGGADGTAHVWEGETSLASLQGPAGRTTSATFSSDGTLVLATRAAGTAVLYACRICGSLDDLVTLARVRAVRQLTPQERARYVHDTGGP